MIFNESLIEFLSAHNQKELRLLNSLPMVSIGTKSSFKPQTGLAKLGLNLGASNDGPIKKAITSAKPNEESDSTGKDEVLEKNSLQNEAQENVKKETELEKKKNLDKLLSRGLAIKKGEKTERETEPKDTKDKDSNKDIDKEWTKNSSANDDGEKSRFEKAREGGLQDQLKNDKDSIAKKYPGLDRPGASGSPSSESKSLNSGSSNGNSSNDNSNFNNGNNFGNSGFQGSSNNSGISKLSENSHNHNQVQPRNNFGDGGSVTRPDLNFGPRGGGFGHNDFPRDNGRGDVNGPDQGHSDHSHKAHNAFESLYTQGHIKENVIQTGSSEDAQRITAGLRGLGVFDNIRQEGNSIRLSGFNSEKSHDIHEAQRNILGQEFLAGRITNFDFESVASNLTKMLESKAQAIGSTQHNIESNCDDGVCKVSLGQKTENVTQNQQEQQYAQNENNSNQNNQEQTA